MNALSQSFRIMLMDCLESYEIPYSESALQLLMMIAAHESGGFTYCKQVKGPALGLFQMEPATFDFVMQYVRRTGKFLSLLNQPAVRMQFDSGFAAAVARVYLWTIPEALPDAEDLKGLAAYAKQYWNTPKGKATEQKYLDDYLAYVVGEDDVLA